MENIPEVANSPPFINSAEFVKLTVYNEYGNVSNVNVYTFSSAFTSEVIDGTTYEPLGGLLQVGAQARDLRVTSADTSIALSGVDGNNIYIVLGTKIKGSLVEITRGFYGTSDGNVANLYNLTNTYPRFTGIVTSYSITEEREGDTDNFTVAINASSYKAVLENRVAGRKTNKSSWQVFDSTDSSMNNVYSIADQAFEFGKKPTSTPINSSGAGLSGGQFSINQSYNQEK
jgi:hypothetical protein